MMNTKTMGFILKGYPRVSETFIAQEIYMLEQQGFKIEILSMRQAREPERQPVVAMIKAPVTYIPEYIFSRDFMDFVISAAVSLVRYPKNYLHSFAVALFKSARQRDDSPIKRHFQAAWLVRHKLTSTSAIAHLHSHFAHSPTELAYYTAWITGLKYTISAHAKDIYTIPPEELRERINASQMIMTCTGYNFDFMRSLPQVQPAKIHKVYHGINLENFKPRVADESQIPLRNLISVGRLVPKKGYGDIFEALKILKGEGEQFSYEIYGSGELKSQLVALRDQLGLQNEIKFMNLATHPQIIERMNQKGIFICGSKLGKDGDRDGIPNTLAEAMAMELPVVATEVSGIPELVEDGVSGRMVPEGNPQALAAAIRAYLQDPEAARAMGKRARIRVAQVFDCQTWIKSCAKLLTPFAEVQP